MLGVGTSLYATASFRFCDTAVFGMKPFLFSGSEQNKTLIWYLGNFTTCFIESYRSLYLALSYNILIDSFSADINSLRTHQMRTGSEAPGGLPKGSSSATVPAASFLGITPELRLMIYDLLFSAKVMELWEEKGLNTWRTRLRLKERYGRSQDDADPLGRIENITKVSRLVRDETLPIIMRRIKAVHLLDTLYDRALRRSTFLRNALQNAELVFLSLDRFRRMDITQLLDLQTLVVGDTEKLLRLEPVRGSLIEPCSFTYVLAPERPDGWQLINMIWSKLGGKQEGRSFRVLFCVGVTVGSREDWAVSQTF